MIFVVIPVFNRINYTAACLESLQKQDFKDFVTVVVDHGSTDGTTEYIHTHFPDVVVLKGDESMWWTAATNLGAAYALANGAQYVLTLNNDLVVDKDYLSSLYNVSLRNGKTIVGSISVDIMQPEKVAYAGTLWNAWLAKYRSSISTTQAYSEIKRRSEVIVSDLLPGRGTLIPVSVFKEIGLFDELNFPHYAADEDFSARAKKNGYSLLISTAAVVRSHVDQTGLATERMSFKYLVKMFSSIKSAKNLKIRWRWALKHARTPAPLYFLIDFSRLLKSSVLK